MGTYKKTLTIDCTTCGLMKTDEHDNLICTWGETKKVLVPKKGKKVIECKLERED